METAAFYGAKAVKLHGIADRTVSELAKAYWRSMARAWDRLATRMEAEDRLILDNFDRASPSQAALLPAARTPLVGAKRT